MEVRRVETELIVREEEGLDLAKWLLLYSFLILLSCILLRRTIPPTAVENDHLLVSSLDVLF